MIGRVVSTKMQKTVAVLIESTKTHPLYKKTFASSKKYLADDPLGVNLADLVEIVKIKPVSKRKHWKVVKVIGRNIEEIVSEELKEKAAEAIEEVMPEEKVESSDKSQESSEEVKNQKLKVKNTSKKSKVEIKKGEKS